MSNEYGKDVPLSYNKYLKVSELTSLQETLSDSHDELFFIIIHQTYELWFKQLLHELDVTIERLKKGNVFDANHALRVITSVEKILISQIHLLETMTPIGFLAFRNKLNPASGFQSLQFRELEFVSGAKDERILNAFKNDKSAHAQLSRRFGEPTLADTFWELLKKRGFDVSDREKRIAAAVSILGRAEKYHDLYQLQDLLIDHDQQILFWRSNHVIMVERMLGMKPGTGGSEGVGYLQTTLNKKFFPELWEARTYLTLPDSDKI